MQWVGLNVHDSISSIVTAPLQVPHRMSLFSLSMVNHMHRSETTGSSSWVPTTGSTQLVLSLLSLVNLFTAVPGPRWKIVVSSFA